MATKTLDQIVTELAGIYDPQVASLRTRQAAIPGEIATEEQALDAKLKDAYGQIQLGAQRKGVGFGGIPLGEQARYASTEYAPALARLRQSGQQRSQSLEDAILGINERRAAIANDIYGREQGFDLQNRQLDENRRQFDKQFGEQQFWAARNNELALRQFDEQQRQFNEQAAAARASSGGISIPSFPAPPAPSKPVAKVDPLRQVAYDDVRTRVSQQSDKELISDFNATQKSANNGNAKDKLKIEVYQQLRPDLFLPISKNYLGGQSSAAPVASGGTWAPAAGKLNMGSLGF